MPDRAVIDGDRLDHIAHLYRRCGGCYKLSRQLWSRLDGFNRQRRWYRNNYVLRRNLTGNRLDRGIVALIIVPAIVLAPRRQSTESVAS